MTMLFFFYAYNAFFHFWVFRLVTSLKPYAESAMGGNQGWWKRCARFSFWGILISIVVLLLGALCFSIVLILSMCRVRDILEEFWWRRGALQRQRNRQSKVSLVVFIISFLLCTVKILISHSLCWKRETSLLFFKVKFVIEIKTSDF